MERTHPQEHRQEDSEGPAQAPALGPVQPDTGGGTAPSQEQRVPPESQERAEEQEALAPGSYDCPEEEFEEELDSEQTPEEEPPLSLPRLGGGRRRKRPWSSLRT